MTSGRSVEEQAAREAGTPDRPARKGRAGIFDRYLFREV